MPKKAQLDKILLKHLCIDYLTFNSLLSSVAYSKVQDVLSFIPLPKIDELYAMLNGLTVYFSLDYTSEYHPIAFLPEVQERSAFMTPFGKFEFKKVPSGLVQAPTYIQQLI